MVLKEASRYRILDGHHAQYGRVFLDRRDNIPKRIARDDFYFFTFMIITGGDVVIRTGYSLYCYFLFHLVSLFLL